MEGLIQPIGGHKGIGLAIMVGMLSTLLSGAGYGLESGNMVDGALAGKDGHSVLALDIAAFQPLAEVRAARGRGQPRDPRQPAACRASTGCTRRACWSTSSRAATPATASR